MTGDEPASPASNRSANGQTIISRQQPRHPGMILAPRVEQRVDRQEVERIRGGCCLCPGGTVWVCSSGGNDEEKSGPAPLTTLLAEQGSVRPSQSSPTGLLPALQTPTSRRSQESGLTGPSVPSGPPTRKSTRSLPTSTAPGLLHTLELGSRPNGRTTATTLPPQARPQVPPSAFQRQGPRAPAHSLPSGPRPKLP